ncbi:glycosyltransferase family 10 [uncultured Polaribacter sp.]|mgnify:CR=1 FL=1|uniref:glycosyltransferase family 10 domain-containing protein n=1 Tax=uncultured Polaribacter sp. TaxID=174711 RepID=UPI00259B1F82|nr:glycosyltransferase family 10 [uncultured Polaribacter sp.]
MKSTSAIAVIPYGTYPNFGLSKMPLDALCWPLGRPQRLMKGTVADMEKTDHLITNPRKSVFLFLRFNVKAQISVVICEPNIIHQKYINWSHFLYWRFYKILTKSETLVKNIENGVLFLNANTFIKDIHSVNIIKKKLLSVIASKKNNLEGHKLRHKIVDYLNSTNIDADIMGRGYKSFEHKEDGLAPYYYSVIIENNQESNYFTEKLIDCFLCETIPIYWGAPNIENYFDAQGMIICKTAKDIKLALKNINSKDYKSKLTWVKANRNRAMHYTNFEKRVATAVQKTLL